ncbi:MAG: acetyl-CoA carboxylase biotin carboxyl carrier protein, partial [Bacilli bacterium]|nr:acetyl-CoA carboxylase biotin carboxyl carrier protein [Bacilli bacterium]
AIDIDFPDGTKISMKKEEKQTKIINTIVEDNQEKDKVIRENIESSKKETISELNIIKSPMVGTFYLKPSPTSEPYVEVGKEVKKGDTVCIIEAMKLMNEIESEFTGKIMEVYVKDGEPVEYGAPLFGIK